MQKQFTNKLDCLLYRCRCYLSIPAEAGSVALVDRTTSTYYTGRHLEQEKKKQEDRNNKKYELELQRYLCVVK